MDLVPPDSALPGIDAPPLARAANPTGTLQLIERERMILDTAKLSDDWEARFSGRVDRW